MRPVTAPVTSASKPQASATTGAPSSVTRPSMPTVFFNMSPDMLAMQHDGQQRSRRARLDDDNQDDFEENDAPKKPCNAFLLYRNQRSKDKQEYYKSTKGSGALISKDSSKLWETEEPELKRAFELEAEISQALYQSKLAKRTPVKHKKGSAKGANAGNKLKLGSDGRSGRNGRRSRGADDESARKPGTEEGKEQEEKEEKEEEASSQPPGKRRKHEQ
ncbi:hypothetical protein BC939DRAFT_457061 [Gamsiella multidivaricata]|uniref:uncharacterized protein n=1 Tax=Gamsiella multidivaricata TaxID=101098 RepID=UPI00221F6A19|nr:uncharacterized protein BC939DRAFT_457061 [Gamsiella multidivaricata]KAI7820832.1 hypothetical protein BC939DRAFT_457061 [Gamsiella multidivaricata]